MTSRIWFLVVLIAAAVVSISAQESGRPSPTPQAGSRPAPAKHVLPTVSSPRLRAVKQVGPVYPEIARTASVQGGVKIEGRIGVNGRVVDVRVVKSIPLLDQAAVDAVRQWEFVPPAGDPAFNATVTFVLSTAPVSDDVPPAQSVGWPPSDFALYYRLECREGVSRLGTGRYNEGRDVVNVPLFVTTSAEAPEYLALLLVQEGFFSISGAATERARGRSMLVHDGGIELTVSAQRPHVDTVGWYGPGRPTPFHHELMVRTFGMWRVLTWNEPIVAGDERDAEASRVGAAVRKFFRSFVEKGAENTAPCR